MTDDEVKERLGYVRAVVEGAMGRYVGMAADAETVSSAARDVRNAIAQLDMNLGAPHVSDLVDVEVTYDVDDPTTMVVSFRRKR